MCARLKRSLNRLVAMTALLWFIAGCSLMMDDLKIVNARCGDGVIEGAEQCDDGDIDDKDGCSSRCVVEKGWECSGEPSKCSGGSCDKCSDNNPCTDDICDSDGACSHQDNANTCDDGDPCTKHDVCAKGACKGSAYQCDDGNPCTDDACDGDGGCSHSNNAASCDDGDPCTSHDVCSNGKCAGKAYNCDDNSPCTDDACDGDGGCSYSYNTTSCDDGDPCTSHDVCSKGKCAGKAYSCDDKNPCTDDACDGDGACSHSNNTASCDDGDPCTFSDVCSKGKCAGKAHDCDDGNPCTDDICSGDGKCSYSYNTDSCDDGDPCTAGDVCGGGKCVPGDLRDTDDDGFVDAECPTGDDCNDAEFAINPDAAEDKLTGSTCCDSIDNNCDGLTDVSDPGCGQCVRFVDLDSTASTSDGVDWSRAYTKVQDGIDAAYTAAQSSGVCRVWVAEGRYYVYQSAAADTVQLKAGVEVYGGFTGTETCFAQRNPEGHETILDGHDSAQTQQVYHVVTGSNGALLDGFTITGGNAAGSSTNAYGGGMYNSSVSPTVANCVFLNNTSSSSGGGMYNNGGSPAVMRCTFQGNRSNNGGGMYDNSSTPVVLNSVFSGNFASGDGGGIYGTGSSFRAINCVLEGNRANGSGGGIYNNAGDPVVVNSTFNGNQAASNGNGIFTTGAMFNNGSSTVRNSIIWNPSINEIYNGAYGSANVYYSDVVGGISNGNIDSDPLFIHVPATIRWTTGGGTTTTVTVNNATTYFTAGDVIEINDDSVARTVSSVGTPNPTTVTFSPPLAAGSAANTRVDNWGAGAADLNVDLRLASGSPCIDAAQDTYALYTDIDGLGRVDIAPPESPSDAGYADMGVHEYSGGSCDFVRLYSGISYWRGCDTRSWPEAETLCVHFGGHLASAASDAENGFIQSLLQTDSWIGGNFTTAWVWSDASAWSYTNWGASQPDVSASGYCTAISSVDGKWFDESCAGQRGFVCNK